MTDNEIIKALECCISDKSCAKTRCPFHNDEFCGTDIQILEKSALDLINRQKAEIDRLNKDSDRLKKVQMQLDDMCIMYNVIKSEAIKEFAERYRRELLNEISKTIWAINVPLEYEQNKLYVFNRVWDCITNKIKEMVGDE